jgi:hypothetical protein
MKYFFVILLWISLSFNAIAQCDQPIYLQAENITSSSADLSWTPNGEEEYWKLEWGLDGFVIGEGNIIDSLESPEYFLMDLDPETSYDYYVWALCEDDISNQSALEFITLPINNHTCDAISITVDDDSTTFVNNTNAVTYGPEPACWSNNIAGVLWYKFELTESSGIEIITTAGLSNDSHIALYEVEGCSDDSLIYTQLYCSEDISQTNWMSYIITEELDAGEYYIQCGTWYNAIGTYDIQVNTAEPVVLPPNDQCGGAVVQDLVVDGAQISVDGNGMNATDENGIGEPHVWEAFSIDACADVSLSFCGSTPIPIAIYSNIYNDCPNSGPVQIGAVNASLCDDDNVGVTFEDLAAGTYYYPVIADSLVGGFESYTLSMSAVTCTPNPQPDTCTTWLNGPFGDFNFYFGGAPLPDEEGNCPIYTMDELSIYASEYYDINNFQAGTDYTFSVCYGEGAGTWPVEIAIMDTLENIIAWADSCQLSFTAPYTGTYFVGFNEAGACGSSSSNTSTNNGYLSVSCGDVIISVEEINKSSFSVFPNPTSGIVSLQITSKSANYGVELMSLSGKVLWYSERYFISNESQTLTLPTVSNGFYLLKVINLEDQAISIERLIIE